MAPNPSRATTSGRVFNDLRNLARWQGRATEELLLAYVLERFLYRVGRSRYAERLVLKGGVLLAVLDARRPTRDADLLALDHEADQESVLRWVVEIAAVHVDDGVEFAIDRACSQVIREGDQYPGVRVVVPATVARARVNLSLDVNFGDPITPAAVLTDFPQMLEAVTFPLWGYPVETVLAEKLVTMVSLGDLNTRDRDWADGWRLTGAHDLDGPDVSAAVSATAEYRGVQPRPLSDVVIRLPQLRQAPYTVWCRTHSLGCFRPGS